MRLKDIIGLILVMPSMIFLSFIAVFAIISLFTNNLTIIDNISKTSELLAFSFPLFIIGFPIILFKK